MSLISDVYFRKTRGLEELKADAVTNTARFQDDLIQQFHLPSLDIGFQMLQ